MRSKLVALGCAAAFLLASSPMTASAAPLPRITGSIVYPDGSPAAGTLFGVAAGSEQATADSAGRFVYYKPLDSSGQFVIHNLGSAFGSWWSESYWMDVQEDRDFGVITIPSLSQNRLRTVDAQGDPVSDVSVFGTATLYVGPQDNSVHANLEPKRTSWHVGDGPFPLVTGANGLIRLDVPDTNDDPLPQGITLRYTDPRDGSKFAYDLSEAVFDDVETWTLTMSDVDVPKDTSAPVLADFFHQPRSPVDVSSGAKPITVTAHLTDYTGANAPTALLSSDPTAQSVGPGPMELVSGTTRDGTWRVVMSLPADAAPGPWTVKLHPLSDRLGNTASDFHEDLRKLEVINTPPPTAPGAPTHVRAQARGVGAATVSWTVPVDGGANMIGYTVTSSPGGITATIPVEPGVPTSVDVRGLEYGTEYTFTVTATNGVGTSPASAPSNAVTPMGVPGRVIASQGRIKGSKVIIKWRAPDPHGSPITKYVISRSKGASKTVSAKNLKAVFKRLKPGRYKFWVHAFNVNGAGARGLAVRVRVR